MKVAEEGASATDAGREFQVGIVRGKKLNLKQLVLAGICRNFSDLNSVENGLQLMILMVDKQQVNLLLIVVRAHLN